MEENKLYLTEENLNLIKEYLQTEFLKRGIAAPIVYIEEYIRAGEHKIRFMTETFQTIPVIFKKLWIDNFGTSVSIGKDEEIEKEYYQIWISVHYSYEHFNGGSNGFKMFDFHFNVSLDNKYITKYIID